MVEGEATPAEIVRLIGSAEAELVVQVRKMNDHYDWQRRFIVLSASRYYNVKKNWRGSWSIQREFEIDHIQGIVLRKATNEFLLKISSQVSGDYLYDGDCGSRLIDTLQRLRPHIRLWVVSGDLDVYRRMKKRPAQRDVEAIVTAESRPSTRNSSKVLL